MLDILHACNAEIFNGWHFTAPDDAANASDNSPPDDAAPDEPFQDTTASDKTLQDAVGAVGESFHERTGSQVGDPIYQGLLDKDIIAKAGIVAAELTKLLRCGSTASNDESTTSISRSGSGGSNAVVFSGCGTSGRLAFLAARRLRSITATR